jgi:hypothetical protein
MSAKDTGSSKKTKQANTDIISEQLPTKVVSETEPSFIAFALNKMNKACVIP